MRAIGYLRVSTDHQAATRYGLDAQRQAITRRAEQDGWDLTWAPEDAASGATTERPGLTFALGQLAVGQADVLVVSHLDRLSRSVRDFADLLVTARSQSWNLVVLDLNLDLSTPQGEFVAHILAAVAQLERRLISGRIRETLAQARRRGVVPGPRPREIPTSTAERITELRADGFNASRVAFTLTSEGIPLPSGRLGVWQPAQVRRIESRLREEAESAA